MVSSRKKAVQVSLVVFVNLFATGVIFGFAALKSVLIRKGVYSELCPNNEGRDTTFPQTCEEQELRLNTIFVTSVAVVNAASLPAGVILDRIGPSRTSILGAVLFGLGNLAFGTGRFFWPIEFDGYFVGFILIALGSPCIFLSSFHISNAFPSHSGLILSLIMAAFSASSTPYAVYNWLDQIKTGGISLKAWFWCYTIVPATFATFQGIFGPKVPYIRRDQARPRGATVTNPPAATYGSISANELPTNTSSEPLIHSQAPAQRDGFAGVVSERSFTGQILSRHFWILVLFFAVYADRVNWLIQTLSEQLVFYLRDPALANRTLTIFTLLLPLGGIIGTPLFGWLLDNRTIFDASLTIMVGGLAYGVLGMLRSTIAQMISISIFVVLRPLLYVFVGDYCGKAFGFRTFGRIYGLVNTVIGLQGLVLGPIDRLVKGPLDGNYDFVNTTWLVAGIFTSTLIAWSINTTSKPRVRVG